MGKFKLFGLAILIICSLAACEKETDKETDDDNNNPPPDTTHHTSGDSTMYGVTFKLDGNDVIIEYDTTGQGYRLQGYVFRQVLSTTDSCLLSYTGGISSAPVIVDSQGIIVLPDSSFFLQFTSWFKDSCDNEKDNFISLFNTGSIDYSTDITEKGINIIWVDGNGELWQSILDFQTGSQFNITEVKDVGVQGLVPLTVRLKGTVNCTLYNSNGSSMVLTEGSFVVTISNCTGC